MFYCVLLNTQVLFYKQLTIGWSGWCSGIFPRLPLGPRFESHWGGTMCIGFQSIPVTISICQEMVCKMAASKLLTVVCIFMRCNLHRTEPCQDPSIANKNTAHWVAKKKKRRKVEFSSSGSKSINKNYWTFKNL